MEVAEEEVVDRLNNIVHWRQIGIPRCGADVRGYGGYFCEKLLEDLENITSQN